MLSLTFYSLGILLFAVEMSDRKAIRSQGRQIAATGPIKDLCTLKVREEDAMNDALFSPLSNCRERAHINQNVSHIKAELEKVVLAPWKP